MLAPHQIMLGKLVYRESEDNGSLATSIDNMSLSAFVQLK
jgi:hypothetical protein